MLDTHSFRRKAQRCRELLRAATAPIVQEQLMLWIREFEQAAKIAVQSRQRDGLRFRQGGYTNRIGEAAD